MMGYLNKCRTFYYFQPFITPEMDYQNKVNERKCARKSFRSWKDYFVLHIFTSELCRLFMSIDNTGKDTENHECVTDIVMVVFHI